MYPLGNFTCRLPQPERFSIALAPSLVIALVIALAGHVLLKVGGSAKSRITLDLLLHRAHHAHMQTGAWDTLYNLLIAVFWFRIWAGDDQRYFFNPYIMPIRRLSDYVFKWLRPLFKGMSYKLIPVAVLVLLVVLRGLLVPSGAIWVLNMGFEDTSTADTSEILVCIALSALSFAIFLFNIWSVSLLYVFSRSGSGLEHPAGTLSYIARPFTELRPEVRPPVLVVTGILIGLALNLIGGLPDVSTAVLVMRLIISALAGWVGALSILVSLMGLLIVVSWIAMFAGSNRLKMTCHDWISLLLGPMRRHPIRVGMVDLSPLVFFFIVGHIVFFLSSVLYSSYPQLN